MQINFIVVGKTSSAEIKNITGDYLKRINRYHKAEEIVVETSSLKINDKQKLMQKEGELILKKIAGTDFVILLDDKGKEQTSVQFAAYLENLFNQSHKKICLAISCITVGINQGAVDVFLSWL